MGVARRLRSTWLASTSTENPIHTTRGPTRTKGSRRRRACLPTGAVSRFSWDGPDEEHFSIYVKSLDWPSPVRLTRSSADDNYPVWSPDGRQIAFYRDSGENSAVYIVPAGGGRETRLTSANGNSLVWSPDGLGVIVADRESATQPFAAYLVSTSGAERRQITHPPAESVRDHSFSISPDGKFLLFARMNMSLSGRYMTPLAGGPERRLTYLHTWIFGSAFLPSGDAVVFSVRKSDAPSLWRLELNTLGQDLINAGPALLPSVVRSGSNEGRSWHFSARR